jgi:hypothetical protein
MVYPIEGNKTGLTSNVIKGTVADVSNLNPDEGVTTVAEIVASPKNDETQNQSQQQKQQQQQQNDTVSSSQQHQPQQQQNQDKPQKEHKQQQHETIHSSQQQQQQNQHKQQEPQQQQQPKQQPPPPQQQHQHHHRHHHHLTEPQHTETNSKNFDEESNNKVLMNCDSEIVSKHKDCQENDNSKTSNGETGCVSNSTDKLSIELSPKNAKSFHKNETGNMSSKSFQEVSTNCPSEASAVQLSSLETSAVQMSSVETSAVKMSSAEPSAVQMSSAEASAVQLSSLETSAAQMSSAETSSSYETTYPVFTGQSEYGQESVHVEPFYRYRVYSESKV